jgi:hypothetical protein
MFSLMKQASVCPLVGFDSGESERSKIKKDRLFSLAKIFDFGKNFLFR